jgi:hypothetical protein
MDDTSRHVRVPSLLGALRDERGSLPMTMLVAIIMGGVVTALYGYIATGQRTARHDRDFNQAIQVADAGMQNAFTELALSDPDDDTLPAIGSTIVRTGTLDHGDWEWTATRISRTRWQVRSEGTAAGSVRVVEANIGPRQLFGLAAFADLKLELRGGNKADSYNDVTWGTGNGAVGSNNQIVLNGNATVDWVMRYANATYNEKGIVVNGVETNEDPAYLPPLGAEAYAEGGVCHGQDAIAYTGQFPLVRGKTYCFTNADFPAGDHKLVGDSPNDPTTAPEPVDPDGPTRIYIAPSGNLRLLGQGNTGCGGAACVNIDPADRPNATALEIYLASGEVLANNHTKIAAGIYAPSSNCSGPNAQGELYGSIICRTLDSKGGWQFHYDDRFRDVETEDFAIDGWREEGPNTTSFGSG